MTKKNKDEQSLMDRPIHSVDDEFLRPIIIRATEEAAIACAATMGYGDITPVSPLVRYLAFMEGIVGQFYIAILVASLVGVRVSNRQQK